MNRGEGQLNLKKKGKEWEKGLVTIAKVNKDLNVFLVNVYYV